MKSSIWKFHIWNFNSIYGIFFPYMEFWNSINGNFFPWKNLNFPGMPKTYPKGLGHAKFSLLVPWWVVYGLGNFFSTRLCMKSYISVSLVWPYILGKSCTFNNLQPTLLTDFYKSCQFISDWSSTPLGNCEGWTNPKCGVPLDLAWPPGSKNVSGTPDFWPWPAWESPTGSWRTWAQTYPGIIFFESCWNKKNLKTAIFSDKL